jgi:hypothetical protein
VQRPPQRLERPRHVPDHRRVRHRESADLGTALVIPRHHSRGDLPVGVREQLRTGRRDLPQVIPDRREQRRRRRLVTLATVPPELVPHERAPLPVTLELGRRDHGRAGGPQPIRERLALRTTRMGDDEADIGVRILGIREQRGDEILTRVLSIADHQHPPPAEQRGAQHLGDLTGGERTRLVLPDVGTRLVLPRGIHGRADRAGRQQLLITLDEQQRHGRRDVHAQHRCTLSKPLHTPHSFARLSGHATRKPTYR